MKLLLTVLSHVHVNHVSRIIGPSLPLAARATVSLLLLLLLLPLLRAADSPAVLTSFNAMTATMQQALRRRRWLTADMVSCMRSTQRNTLARRHPRADLHTTPILRAASTPQPPPASTSSSTHPNLVDLLSSRGFISASTHPLDQLRTHFSIPRTLYAGFDPTAPSLHLGNLLVLLALSWAQHCGHRVIAVVGGGTGLVGDPTGRQQERQRMTDERLETNMRGIEASMRQILQPSALVINNLDWLRTLPLLTFLRDIGSHYRIATLLSKASIQSRLASSSTAAPSAGLSYTEFSYQLLQGYDWLQLHDRHDCTVQLGGSDQWGNITSGMELINRLRPDATVHGITLPLLTTAAGEKFGKSAGNALWLDPRQTSPYQLYQHMLHSHDSDVPRYMRTADQTQHGRASRQRRAGWRERAGRQTAAAAAGPRGGPSGAWSGRSGRGGATDGSTVVGRWWREQCSGGRSCG